MEPGGGRLPVQVLGENEALQQFFSGQDVSGVLDNSVAVDTSILEQYLSTDMDANSFMLPESPPDSSSEACSPAQMPDSHYEPPYWSNQPPNQEVFQPTQHGPGPSSSCRFKDRGSAPAHHQPLTHSQLHALGDAYIKSGASPVQQHAHLPPERYPSADSCLQAYTPPTPPSPPALHHSCFATTSTAPGLDPGLATPASTCLLGSASTLHNHSSDRKKRRRSESEETSAGINTSCSDGDTTRGGGVAYGAVVAGQCLATNQFLTWEQYQPENWLSLYGSSYETLAPPAYHVDTDKGFIYSVADEAFVCQKKNHFQVTVHIGMAAEPQYVQTPSGPQQVDHLLIKVFGVKLESPSHQVTIEQSQPDRSKKPFHPVRVSVTCGKITKITLGRLHFSETTANNMRKKGKPNPDQRYFQMVVGLYAAVGGAAETFLLTALVSERIIVRASNPGQFEMDGDALWQRGAVQDAVVCQGRVGINTDSPDEALVVCGNAKVMGAIMQPSDLRAKENVQEVDSEQQLKRITQMRIVEFDYKPEFAVAMGIDHAHQTGVIAQEVKELLPSAVREVGDVGCSDGEKIHNFLMVDKEQIFMENVGAVQQLSKLTDNLETRIQELEVWNRRLAKLKRLSGSLRSSGKHSSVSTSQDSDTSKAEATQKEGRRRCTKHRVFRGSVLALLVTMAFCVIAITTLYLVKGKEDNLSMLPGSSLMEPDGTSPVELRETQTPPAKFHLLPSGWRGDTQSLIPKKCRTESAPPALTTAWRSTVTPSVPPGPWPPDLHFCDLLYCEEVYCCSLPGGGSTEPNVTTTTTTTTTTSTSTSATPGEDRFNMTDKINDKLKNNSDWTNTTIQSFMIKENQHVIDSKYCPRDECGSGQYVYNVPISQFVPVNMRVTLIMNSTEVLVVHLCGYDESAACPTLLDVATITGSSYPSNTQGEHEWPLHVSRLYRSSYHFRSTVAGQADCSTDHHFAGVLFTDYHFYFYRRCLDS